MGMLDPRQLTAIQTKASKTFDLVGIQVQRATRTRDATGAYSETWSTIATVAGGWNKPSPQMMQAYAGLIGAEASWLVRLPIGTNVKNNDRLVMPSGDVLTVQSDLTLRSYASCVRVLATEIR